MEEYYKQHADSLIYFKAEARKAFAPICEKYGLREQEITLDDLDNLFQVTFANTKIRITVEGINWGMNTYICFGMNERKDEVYSIYQLIKEHEPSIPITGNQTEQLYGYAHYLETYAPGMLLGDPAFFDALQVRVKKEKEDAQKLIQAETEQKLSAGYLKIDTSFGETIWRKPRPSLVDFSTAKSRFPSATEIRLIDLDDFMSTGEGDVIITRWLKELNDTVTKNEPLFELSTDKASMEIRARETGRLVWLLEEGEPVKTSDCIALINLS